MKFSKQEIMFLTSVSRGRRPLGVTLEIPSKGNMEEYVERTIQQLTNKNILDEKRKLTKDGAQILSIWERYRNSEKHIFINGIWMAVLSEGKLIVLIPLEDGYEVQVMMPELIMFRILKENQYLCLQEAEAVRGKWENLDIAVWLPKVKAMDSCMLLKEYQNGKIIGNHIYCMKEMEGWLINLERKRVRRLSSRVMRRQMYSILGGSENGYN